MMIRRVIAIPCVVALAVLGFVVAAAAAAAAVLLLCSAVLCHR